MKYLLIIIAIVHVEPNIDTKLKQEGADGYVAKSIGVKELQVKISRVRVMHLRR
jgi:CheY-like chemotaxis protein